MIRPRLKMARRAITQQQQGQQPGMRDAPQTAQQSNQGPAPTTQARARAIYRPGGATSGAAPQAPSQIGGPRIPVSQFSDAAANSRLRGNANNLIPTPGATPTSGAGYDQERRADSRDADVGVPDPYENLPDEPAAPKSEEELIADMVRQYLEGVGNIDTTEQEALINEQMQEKLAMDLMNQRASAGASGFEASGSLIGMEGDIRRGAARDATGARLDARRQAEEDAFGRAMGVADLSANERKMALEEWKAQQQFDALNRWLESESAAPGSGGSPPVGDTDGDGDVDIEDAQAAADAYKYITDPDTEQARTDNRQAGEKYQAEIVDEGDLPPGAYVAESDGDYDYYRDPMTGAWYRVATSPYSDGTRIGGSSQGSTAAPYNPEG